MLKPWQIIFTTDFFYCNLHTAWRHFIWSFFFCKFQPRTTFAKTCQLNHLPHTERQEPGYNLRQLYFGLIIKHLQDFFLPAQILLQASVWTHLHSCNLLQSWPHLETYCWFFWFDQCMNIYILNMNEYWDWIVLTISHLEKMLWNTRDNALWSF